MNFQMVAMNQRLNTEIETVFLMADPRHQAISLLKLPGEGDRAARRRHQALHHARSGGRSHQTQQGKTVMAEYLILELKDGPVKIKLRPDLAPGHVERIKTLAGQGFYDGVVFHRVIPGFMAQTGDPTGTGSGGSDLPDLKAEFSNEKHTRGTVSAARTANPNSANSQFYICFDDAPWLDRQYSVWGQVEDGMDVVDKIKKGGELNNGTISGAPDKILKARIEAE